MRWFGTDKSYLLSASLICGDPLRLESEIRELEEAGIEALHFDPMDGHFVPRIGMYPEMLSAVKRVTKLPVDVHMMFDEPQKYIPVFAKAGADVIAVHAEAKGDLRETVKLIREQGAKAGVAVKPDTPLAVLDSVIGDVDLVLIMAIHPGILGQKMIPETLDRISSVSKMLEGRPDVVIEIDGGVTPETAPEMIRRGAHLLVCGTGTIYRPQEDTLLNKTKALRETIDAHLS